MPLPVKLIGGATTTLKDARKTNPCLPDHQSKIIMVGETGSGKTAMLFTIMSHGENDYVCINARNVHNAQYSTLKKMYENAKGGPIPGHWGNDIDSCPDITEMPSGGRIFTVFDDLQNESKKAKKKVEDHFASNRWAGASPDGNEGETVAFLAQNLIEVPKNVREAANWWFLFAGIPEDRLHIIYKAARIHRITFPQFVELYNQCTHNWRENHGCLTVWKDAPNAQSQFRYQLDGGFRGYIIPMTDDGEPAPGYYEPSYDLPPPRYSRHPEKEEYEDEGFEEELPEYEPLPGYSGYAGHTGRGARRSATRAGARTRTKFKASTATRSRYSYSDEGWESPINY